MNRGLGALLAGLAANRLGGCGCIGTIFVIIIVYFLLGQF
jgi:hypothetical protein